MHFFIMLINVKVCKTKKEKNTDIYGIFPSTKVSLTLEITSGFTHKQVFCISVF